MITVKNITYKTGDNTLVDDISVEFKPGIVNLIVGPNGAGKSTLIKMLSGQMKETSGMVMYGGKPLGVYTLRELAKSRALLSQNMELAFSARVSEVVMMGRYPHFSERPTTSDLQACDEAMKYADIAYLKDRDYTTLSGGEKQRVQFARVLAQIWYPEPNKCRYLLLDEPLAYLDVYYQHQLMQQIKLLRSDTLVVVGVVHDLNIAAKYGESISMIHRGKLLLTGTPESVFTEANIKEVYGVEAEILVNKGKPYICF